MGQLKDLTGKRFGRLTVISRAENKGIQTRWNCHCDCGNITCVFGSALRHGHTKSCGCIWYENIQNKNKTHGLSDTRMYEIYYSMKKRCRNKRSKAYKNYGGRGIKICDEWLGKNGFINFYEWSINNGYSDELTLDRINVNGNYCSENCRWATYETQANNRRTNHNLEYRGQILNIKQWSKLTGIERSTIGARIKLGWSVEKALSAPTRKITKAAAGERMRKMWADGKENEESEEEQGEYFD